MKADEISYGYHDFGMFRVSIQACVFDERPADEVSFFEVLVLEVRAPDFHVYIDINEDERFAWFKHFGTFARALTNDDLVEYNHRVSAVFYKIGHPTWKLARYSIPHLEKLCLDATKAAKKAAKK